MSLLHRCQFELCDYQSFKLRGKLLIWNFDTFLEQSCAKEFTLHILVRKVISGWNLYHMMKDFYFGLFQDDSAPSHRPQGLMEWFHQEENDVNYRTLKSPDLSPIQHLLYETFSTDMFGRFYCLSEVYTKLSHAILYDKDCLMVDYRLWI